ncbi:hypothetical protein C8R47DRAFT_1227850 [Mycena vitilis]|nr:hypothetical protein C8R47DRAFT_1227850 [Mycena vitilis]
MSRFWADDLQTNAARDAVAFSYSLGDESIEPLEEVPGSDGITVLAHIVRNANSDRPLKTWYPESNTYLNENLRREGCGDPAMHKRCAGVHCRDPNKECPNHKCAGVTEFRCVDEACFGEVMHCAQCIVAAHSQLPTHFIEKWDGKRFVRDRRWLQKLGLRMQLGHRRGGVCTFRHAAPHDFVLYDVNGVHEINVDFCGCLRPDGTPVPKNIQLLRACWWPATVLAPKTCATFRVLRLFHVMNCLGKLSAYDFIRSLEKCTNHNGLDKPPDRRKPFMHIMRQWREVKRMKRGRRGHDASGARGTKKGELVLVCRACPQPYWNLPEGWENASQVERFIYFLFLAQNANFRLSNRNVSSEEADPIWGDGTGYFCTREGEDGQGTHRQARQREGDVELFGVPSYVSGQYETRQGLADDGDAGVTCSRHNMWRANGLGDLQVYKVVD